VRGIIKTVMSRLSRSRLHFRNVGFGVLDQLLQPLLLVIATPVFLAWFGAEQYGTWMLANTVMGFTGAVGFGLADATVRFVAQARERSEVTRIRAVISGSLLLYGFLALVLLGAGWLCSPWLAQAIFRNDEHLIPLTTAVLRLAFVGIVVRLFDSVFQAAMQGFERYDLPANVSMTVNVVAVGGGIVLAMTGATVVATVAYTITAFAAGALLKAWLLRRFVRNIFGVPVHTSREVWRELRHYATYTWLQGLSGMLLNQVDRLIVAALLGASALTYYSVALQACQMIHALVARGAAVVLPLAARLQERGQHEELLRLYVRSLDLTLVAGVSLGLPLFMLAPQLLTVWVGPQTAQETADVFRALALAFTVLTSTIVPYYFMNGTGLVKLNAVSGAVSGGAVAVAAAVLIAPLGLLGAGLARLVNVPITVYFRYRLHSAVFGRGYVWLGFLHTLPVMMVFGAGFLCARWLPDPLSLTGVAMWSVLSAAAGGAATFLSLRTLKPLLLRR